MFLELQKEMCFVPTKKSGEKIKIPAFDLILKKIHC